MGLVLSFVYYPREMRSQPLVISLNENRQLIGKLYTPKNSKPPYPVMLLIHGVKSTKEMMTPLAQLIILPALLLRSSGFRWL
jgi:hypothetical protein